MTYFSYHTEPYRSVAITLAILLILSLIVRNNLAWLLLAMFGIGPALWVALQWVRRNRGISVADDNIIVAPSIIGRTSRIPQAALVGARIMQSGGLALAYLPAARPTVQPAIQPQQPQQPHIMVLPMLDQVAALHALLTERAEATTWLDADTMRRLINRRRQRLAAIGGLLIVLIPVYVYVGYRIASFFRSAALPPFP